MFVQTLDEGAGSSGGKNAKNLILKHLHIFICGCDMQYRLSAMYGYLHLANIKDHFNKERYRLRGRDGGLGELPGCSLSIHSGGLGARTGAPKRDVQTHKKEGNQSRCAHGGMCVMVKTWLQALHNSLFSACHSPAPSRSLTYKK